ncbi:protein kinase [Trypanosoma conorhini]|uniref:non-specific serine/threonine protein kinase n=1 Tax=Trypanosoma conorhini TaxID=83891 RepID=A0A3R7MM94_9TRYP|nr:protein kinase [Trypanosoma conorhini]RNF05069.1 protein kinase [Trypanosoma conorhini]
MAANPSPPQLDALSGEAYLRQRGVADLLQSLSLELMEQKPKNHLSFMQQWLAKAAEGKGVETAAEPSHSAEGLLLRPASFKGRCGMSDATEAEANATLIPPSPELAEFLPVKELIVDSGVGELGGTLPHAALPGERVLLSDHATPGIPGGKLAGYSTAHSDSLLNTEAHHVPGDPEVIAATRRLTELVCLLPPSEHVAAAVFLESLLEKKTSTTSSPQTLVKSAPPVGANCNTIGNLPPIGDANWPPSEARPSIDAFRSIVELPLSCPHLQDLVRDALTTSILSQGPMKIEDMDGNSGGGLPDIAVSPSPGSVTIAAHGKVSLVPLVPNSQDVGVAGTQNCVSKPLSASLLADSSGGGTAPKPQLRAEESAPALLQPPTVLEEELDTVREAIPKHKLFSELDETGVEYIVRHLEQVSLNAGQTHTFRNEVLFVGSGALLEEKVGMPHTLAKGDSLGEPQMSQTGGGKKHYKVRAVSDSVVFLIRIENYRFLLNNEKVARRSMFLDFIAASPLLSILGPGDRKRFADTLRVRSYEAGKMLLRKDRPVEWVSFVLSGTVKRSVEDEAGLMQSLRQKWTENKKLTSATFLDVPTGGVIGVLELLFHSNSLTDATAASKVLVAQVHAVYFESLVPQNSLEEMRWWVLSNPRISWLVRYATEDVRRRVEEVRQQHGLRTMDKQACDAAEKEAPSTASSIHRGSRVVKAGRKSTEKENDLKIASTGEIVYSGTRNLYRFPLSILELSNTIIIAVVSDGVIIRWNATAARVTGVAQQDALGQHIYSLIATDSVRRGMREQLLKAQRFIGTWEKYTAAGLSSPCVYRFRQASELYYANLLLSVVPSCLGTVSDVLLLVGREADNPAMVNYVEDGERWMRNVLQPQLNAFYRRVKVLEKKNWELTSEDGQRLLAHVETCNTLMDHYMRVSHFNLESLQELWKAVRIQHTLRQFVREMLQIVSAAENCLTLSFEEDVPTQEVFFDVEHLLELLRRVVVSANKSGTGILISIVVSVVKPALPDTPCREGTQPVIFSGGGGTSIGSQLPMPAPSLHSTLSRTIPERSQSVSVPTSDGLRLCSSSQQPQVVQASSPSSMRRLLIVVTDAAELETCREGDAKLGPTAPPNSGQEEGEVKVPKKDDARRRMSIAKACERLAANMCGDFSFEASQGEHVPNRTSIEFPLITAPWAEEEDQETKAKTSIAVRPLSVVVAERDMKQRYLICRTLWARRHAVVPLMSLHEAFEKVEGGGTDVLVIDPLYLDATEEEYAALRDGAPPFDTLRQHPELVIVVYADDFNDWRVKKLTGYCHVIELPKPASVALLHLAVHEAEQVVMSVREEEEQIALLRTAFTEFQPERHKVVRPLGKGAFGEVFEVEDLLTGGRLAMKRMRLDDGVLADEIVQELLAMTSLSHENIIHYFYCQKASDTQLCLYMELASGGTLSDKVRERDSPLPLEEIVRYLQDLCRGLAYLHSKNYVHRDIKTANALIDNHGRVKIGDFGSAKQLKRPSDLLFTVTGTPRFMAPEVVNADATKGLGYNQKADIWSLGCVALELATCQAPFSYLDTTRGMGIFMYISKLADTPDLSVIEDGNPYLYAFIKACLCVDPEKRPTAQELVHHDLMQEVEQISRNGRVALKVEMVENLLRYAAINSEDEDYEADEEEEGYGEGEELDDAGSSVAASSSRRKSVGSEKLPVSLRKERECELHSGQKEATEKLLGEEDNFFASTTATSSEED